jgi:hypothetical protein
MFTERDAIKLRMEQIIHERRLLQEEYQTLMNRLRELDMDQREVQETAKAPVEKKETETSEEQPERKRRKRADVQGEVIPAIVEILREEGEPLKAKKISLKLDERGVKYNNIHTILHKLVQEREDIVKEGFGYYAYKEEKPQ